MDLKKDLFGRKLKDDFLDTDKTKRYFNSIDLSTNIRDIALVINGIKNVLNTNQKFNYNKQLFDCSPDAFYGDIISQTGVKKKFNNIGNDEYGLKIFRLFHNHITEEVNDTNISCKYPGYGNLLKKRKEILFGGKDIETSSDYVEFVDLLLKLLRFPTKINEDSYNKFKDDVEIIQNHITETYNSLPVNSRNIDDLVEFITEIAEKYYVKDEIDNKEQEKNNGLEEFFQKYDKTDSNPILEDDKKFNNTINQEIENIDYEKEEETCSGLVHFEYITTGNPSFYNKIVKNFNLSKASSLSRILARKNRDYSFTLKSMRSGRLDTNKLAEAKQKVSTIYERIGEVHTDKLCIGILLDMSGSMHGSKITKARETMIYLYELLKNNKDIELFIYGHTADYQNKFVNIFIFKENKHFNKYSLATAEALANNKDGYAINAIAKRIRKFTNKKGIIFVISDGQPHGLNYSGQMAIEHTKSMVIASQKLGFQIIQIAIQGNIPSNQMFDYYVDMTNIETLPNQLITYVSKYVDKELKIKTTL